MYLPLSTPLIMEPGYIYQKFIKDLHANEKRLALLIDPDRLGPKVLVKFLDKIEGAGFDYIFLGGSLMTTDHINLIIEGIRDKTGVPVVLFPGSQLQVSNKADALLFLSLISGRNAELLIGKHVEIAPLLDRTGLEIISTGYMLVDGGKITSASYMSHSLPIPWDKPEIAASTALAGSMLGLSTFYLDAGSGAINPVNKNMIREVKSATGKPLIVGGGIKTASQAQEAAIAGADTVVVGTAAENDPGHLKELAAAVHELNSITIPK